MSAVTTARRPAASSSATRSRTRQEGVRILRTGHRPATVEHVGRHGGDAELERLGQVARDLGLAAIRGQVAQDLVPVEAALGGQLGEGVGVADVAALGEVGPEQALLQRPPARRAVGASRQHPVGQQGVGPQGPVEVEVQALLGGQRGHPVDHLVRLPGAELALVDLPDRGGAPGGAPRIELEGPERHADILRSREAPERRLEPPLADVAPRADDVGPDVDVHPAARYGARWGDGAAATFCATLADEAVRAGVRHVMVSPRFALDAAGAGARRSPGAGAPRLPRRTVVLLRGAGRRPGHRAAGARRVHERHRGRPAPRRRRRGAPGRGAAGRVHRRSASGAARRRRPQTIDQARLFGGAVRACVDLGAARRRSGARWRSLVSRAIADATGPWPGPVHLNLPFRDPLVGVPGELPPRPCRRPPLAPHAVRDRPARSG